MASNMKEIEYTVEMTISTDHYSTEIEDVIRSALEDTGITVEEIRVENK